MGIKMRPELSEKNKYWIDKHRYYELKHFCLQYPTWKKAYNALDGLSSSTAYLELYIKQSGYSDPTAKYAEAKAFYSSRIELVQKTALFAEEDLSKYILKGVTEGVSYDYLKVRLEIPCSKETYYDRYRRFFWLLNKEKG